jgi:hypothetical protein
MTALGSRVGRAARIAVTLALCAAPLAQLAAQASLITMPKQAAQRAVGAENAQLGAQMAQARAAQGQQIGPAQAAQQGRAQAGAPAAGTPQGTSPSPGVVQSGAARTSDPGAAGPAARAPGSAPDPGSVIMREVFDYNSEGRRDPFFSLMATGDLRPMLSDLRLTTILYDLSGRRPVAVMNDVSTNVQYRVTTGMMLGRMRVTAIKPRKVIFAIDEFGFSRADSLVLADKPQTR